MTLLELDLRIKFNFNSIKNMGFFLVDIHNS